jgi:hypothetical protein
MYRSAVVFGFYLSFAIAIGAACSNGSPQLPDIGSFTPAGSGGTAPANGGTMGTSTGGTAPANGGTTGTSTGGTTGGSLGSGGSGGTTGTAGHPSSGGMTSTTGGTTSSAGHAGTGGTVSTGGGTSTGGTTSAAGTGGTVGAAGTTTMGGAGTSGVACDTAFSVGMDGFVRMPAKDGSCWHGYAYATGDSCTSSGCTGMTTIQYCGGTATGFPMCKGMLSIAGTLNASTSANMYAGFVLIGFSLNEPAGGGTKGTVTPTGTGIVVTGTAAAGRVQLQNGSTYYCATFTSGTVIPYTSFNTKCYDMPPDGTAYAKGPIDTIALQIPGGMAAAAYSISLTDVKEM